VHEKKEKKKKGFWLAGANLIQQKNMFQVQQESSMHMAKKYSIAF
jgi:hypothetical protein